MADESSCPARCVFLLQMNVAKLQKMVGDVRTGGKGTVRRKKKAVHKSNTTDDKRLQAALKRSGVNTIPDIEEVLLMRKDNNGLVFTNPKVQANITALTYVVSGPSVLKSSSEIMKSLVTSMGGLANIMQAVNPAFAPEGGVQEPEGDDEVPTLVENFEEVVNVKA
ncbi:hypothetical protein H632_c1612p0 [Helicosporidium sp. ATCC 50920]|nr:hypothetical protein H632_c1612p0 [Helicosporidium sp. ATCC 50920]|eukprot:KDD74057.1 hypothetical protein H632_c1612p0 [Helicosporidium sp. ATCC 50920]